MPDTYAAEVESTPVAAHAILWISVIFLVVAIVWANLAKLDEVTHATGRVIPSGQIQVVQNLEGGILTEVLVKAGDHVTQNQILIRMDDTRFASSFDEGVLTSQILRAKIARLQAEISGDPFESPEDFPAEHMDFIEDERQLYHARQQELNSGIDILYQQLTQHRHALAEVRAEEKKLARNADLAVQELALTEPLVETGAVSRVELLRLQIAVNESLGRLEVTQLTVPKAQAIIAEAQEKIQELQQQFTSMSRTEMNEAKSQLSRLRIANVALEDRVMRTDVRSPVDGTVKRILVNTTGGVIQPGMDLIEIVPSNDTLLVEAKIRPSDIAFIHPGQQATVKLTAYDFAIYGGLDSVLELISADSITDETGEHFFQIRVRTNKNYLGSDNNPLPIIPGMTATVDIITGEKTVMDYILKPLKRAQASALSER
ncbi:MAG: HlyD family type I secretion periplasmic adaptor subunit [Proteobacteria bacterium]|nr:HlyD family type I secretion periplasmic adaptor subunit [Pseudomonadota bacterium]